MKHLRALIVVGATALLSGCALPQMSAQRSPEFEDGRVILRYRAPSARVVQVSGSWEANFHLRGRDWTSDQRVGQMEYESKTGIWSLELELPPGRYEYLFLVDGRLWELDPNNPQRASDAAGGMVSLFVVP